MVNKKELRKIYRKQLIDEVTNKLLKVLDFTGLDEINGLIINYREMKKSRSISGKIKKLYYVNKEFNYIKVDMDYGEYDITDLDIGDLDTTDLEMISFNKFCGYYKNNNFINLSSEYEN